MNNCPTKIDELITILEKIKKKHGNLFIKVKNDEGAFNNVTSLSIEKRANYDGMYYNEYPHNVELWADSTIYDISKNIKSIEDI